MGASLATRLESLLHELKHHPVNTNQFFETFKDQYLRQDQLRTFLRQYHYFCKRFVKLLEGLLYRTPLDQVEMRIELVKTLHSELGSGSLERAHITLLNRFANALGLTETELEQTIPIPEVQAYMEVLHHLFTEEDYLTALGAEMAVEVTASSEFHYLYPGVKKYPSFCEKDIEFFYLHSKEEECHGTWLIQAVHKTAHSAEDHEKVAAGARATVKAWHEFWQGLYREMF